MGRVGTKEGASKELLVLYKKDKKGGTAEEGNSYREWRLVINQIV